MKNQSKQTLLVNMFGTLGYLFCLLLWGWAGLLFLPMILENDQVERFLMPTPSEEAVSYTPQVEMSPLTIFIALAITAAVLIMTVIVFLRAPVTIARTGKTVTTKAATSAMPLVTHNRPVAPAKKRILTIQLIKLTKLLLVLLPLTILIFGRYVELPLAFDIAVLVGGMLALVAMFCFSLQYIFARVLSIEAKQLV